VSADGRQLERRPQLPDILVDREAVRFLRQCEGQGMVLRNCPPYIRGWMAGGEEDAG